MWRKYEKGKSVSREVPYKEQARCDLCNCIGAFDFMGDMLCGACATEAMVYPVTCARCGKEGTSATFEVEEGDEWECPECWERCEAQERARSSASV